MRKFEGTHPWIRFHLELTKEDPALWILLGEAASKCEHIAGIPIQPDDLDHLNAVYLAKGVQATTAIEGNTLSEEEVLAQIKGKLELSPSREYLGTETANIIAACNQILQQAREQPLDAITPSQIQEYNKQVLANLEAADHVSPGEYRTNSVVVGGVYRGAPAEDCEYLMDQLCEWLNGDTFKAKKPYSETVFALIKAVIAHLYLVWIHPFGDGNGRTARLLELRILLAAGVPQPAAHLLSNHYNKTRAEYARQLGMASRSGGEIFPFIIYAIRGFVDGLREQVKFIRAQQIGVSWEHFVHERFQHLSGPAAKRQRDFMIAFSREHGGEWSSVESLQPDIRDTRNYRAFIRDLKALEGMDLIEREGKNIRAKLERILAFLPWRKRI
jgi:Fic family protein